MSTESQSAQGASVDLAISKGGGNCPWTASTDSAWIALSGETSGTNSAMLKVLVAANGSTSPRTGMIRISWPSGMAQVAVNQNGLTAGQCAYSFTAPAMTVRPEGGLSSVPLSVTGYGCRYELTSDARWLIITATSPGTTSTSIGFDALPNNDGADRTATITASYLGGEARTAITQMAR